MFGLYVIATGELLRLVPAAPDPMPEGHALATVPDGALLGITHDWNPATFVFDARPTVGVYDTATGRLVSVGLMPNDVPQGMAYEPLPANAVYGVTHVWSDAGREWIDAPPQLEYTMTAGDFMRRLGFTREAYLHAVRMNASTPIEVRAQLETLVKWLDRIVVSGVDLRDPIVPMGVAIMAAILDAGGQLTEGVEAFTAMMMAPRVVT